MKKLFLSVMVIVGFTVAAYAQPSVTTSAQASSSATIVGPRSVQKTGNLNFGTIVRGIVGDVTVSTADVISVTNSVVHLGGTVTAAKFRINADEGTTFSVTFQNATVTLTESFSAETMVAGTFTSSLPGGIGSIAIGDTFKDITVGGTLAVASVTQAAGDYLNNDPTTGLKVTVNFD